MYDHRNSECNWAISLWLWSESWFWTVSVSARFLSLTGGSNSYKCRLIFLVDGYTVQQNHCLIECLAFLLRFHHTWPNAINSTDIKALCLSTDSHLSKVFISTRTAQWYLIRCPSLFSTWPIFLDLNCFKTNSRAILEHEELVARWTGFFGNQSSALVVAWSENFLFHVLRCLEENHKNCA